MRHAFLALALLLLHSFAGPTPAAAQSCDPIHQDLRAVGLLDLGAPIDYLAVQGPYAYVSAEIGAADLHVVDLSDPAHPVLGAGIDAGSAAEHPVIEGRYLYLPAGTEGLVVIDLGDPADPVVRGSATPPDGYTYCVDVCGDHAYVADSGDGFHVFDVSDPDQPLLVASLYDLFTVDIEVVGDHAYVATGDEVVVVLSLIHI